MSHVLAVRLYLFLVWISSGIQTTEKLTIPALHNLLIHRFLAQGGGRGDGLGAPGPRLDRKESYKAQRKNYR